MTTGAAQDPAGWLESGAGRLWQSDAGVCRVPEPVRGSADPGDLAGARRHRLGAVRRRDRQEPVSAIVPPTTVVWLRLVHRPVVVLAGRPAAAPWPVGVPTGCIVVAFGVCLVTMNWAIYQSFARIPLGIAVTIEFLGPLAVAIAARADPRPRLGGAGRPRRRAARLIPGRARSGQAWPSRCSPACCWACYILLSAQTGRRWPGHLRAGGGQPGRRASCWPAGHREAGSDCSSPGSCCSGSAVGLLAR